MPDGVDITVSENGLLDHSAYWLHRLSSAVLARFEASLTQTGITVAQWKVMLVLYRGEATTTFSVASFINVDAGSVTRVIDRLEAKGMIVRTPNAVDKRATDIHLTDSGKDLLETRLLPIADEQDDDWLNVLSPAELIVFKSLLSRLLDYQGIEAPERWVRTGLCTETK